MMHEMKNDIEYLQPSHVAIDHHFPQRKRALM